MEGMFSLSTVMAFFVLPALIALGAALVFPSRHAHKRKREITPVSRQKIMVISAASVLAGFIGFTGVLAITEPSRSATAEQRQVVATVQYDEKHSTKKAKPVTKTETTTEVIPYAATEQKDSSLAYGQRRVATKGANGLRTITYEVTYVNDQQTSIKEVKNTITSAPIAQVTLVGTHIEKVAVTVNAPDSKHSATQASAPAPTTPAGATGKCKDGSYTYSKTRRNACRGQGGVAVWY